VSEPGKSGRGLLGRLLRPREEPPKPKERSEAAERAQPESPLPRDEAARSQRQAVAAKEPEPRSDLQGAPAAETEPEQADAEAAAEPARVSAAPGAPAGGWFGRLRAGLTKTSSRLSDGITGLFTKRKLDVATLDDLEDLLIQADLGFDTARRIADRLAEGRYEKGISADDVRHALAQEVERVLAPVARPLRIDPARKPHVILMVGVNGTGKTTTIGKLAARFRREGETVMLAAGDTFRAAAIDQLKIWGERTGAPVVARAVGADASGLAYDALSEAKAGGTDVLLLDTAGRLQNKEALMAELEKVVRVLRKLDPSAPHDVLLVLDATTGQNALAQVEVFRERAGVTGLVMTKLDGTARGGILVAIAARFGLPVYAVGVGEGVDDLQPFDAGEFARAIALG
jgi:fused signal recognition particle receptor